MNRRYSIGGGGKPSYSKGFGDFSCRNFINYCHAFFEKTFAFTLAETLIVMGIIGVVAALTLPNLNSSTGDKEKVAKVKKIYQNLTDALGRAQAVYGPLNGWPTDSISLDSSKRFGERLTEFMKVSKSCGLNGNGAGCTANNYKYLDGDDSDALNESDFYNFTLADGMNIATYWNYGSGGFIYVDIDGSNKGSNTWGKDIFDFVIKNGELYPAGYDITNEDTIKAVCFLGGERCTNWVIQNENMDYLKCPGELSLTNTTCK